MNALDVNILLPSFRDDAGDHEDMRHWLQQAVDGPEVVAVSDAVLGAVVRILTNPRVFRTPTPLPRAIGQAAALRGHVGVTTLAPGPRHWEIFQRLCLAADARGNDVADAQHAALAIEHGATWITKDRGFARFPGLRWRHPRQG